MGEQEYRAGGALSMLLFALGGLGWLMFLMTSSSIGQRVIFAGAIVSGSYQVALAIRTRVVVDDRVVRIRWVARSRTVRRADVVDVQRRRRHLIRLVLASGGEPGAVTLPTVRDTDGLERALRSQEQPAWPPPDLVIHQGGLVRRWTGPTYTP